MTVLVTGGAGYIGSHMVRMLVEKGYNVVVLDNLSRGHIESVACSVLYEKADILDINLLRQCFKKYKIDAVIHFAAFAYVGESTKNPALYYKNNVIGSYNLINVVNENNIKNFVFSSTCSVYGNPEKIPISEEQITNPINPYAKTKLTIENILNDYDTAYNLKSVSLRYFNAAGDSDDSLMGESHNPEPHLIPRIMLAAAGKLEMIEIYGDDYNTKDGTCLRDYIHVNDLADAHIKALEYLLKEKKSEIINLGTGEGYTVKEIIQKSEEITRKKIKVEIVSRRPGDPAVLIADNKKAKELLGWSPKYNLAQILKTAWNWHKNPKY
jgi:UDP-glucose 4-epimerase